MEELSLHAIMLGILWLVLKTSKLTAARWYFNDLLKVKCANYNQRSGKSKDHGTLYIVYIRTHSVNTDFLGTDKFFS